MKADLPFPVKQEIHIDRKRIMLLKLPPKVVYNRNVFCVDLDDNFLWQIEELSFYPGAYEKCHYANMEFKDGILILWNWCDLRLEVDPDTGAVLNRKEVR
jgi:hypothetical protein